jgi:hypothetical protein
MGNDYYNAWPRLAIADIKRKATFLKKTTKEKKIGFVLMFYKF